MTRQMTGRAAEILLVEDNPGDERLTAEALQVSRLLHNLHVVRDGEEALAFLRREGPHADAPRPDLILLDLNLPKKGGCQVLEEMAADRELKDIPVAIMTLSHEDADLLATFDLGAKSYIVKPVDLEQFLGVVRLIRGFWSGVVDDPSR